MPEGLNPTEEYQNRVFKKQVEVDEKEALERMTEADRLKREYDAGGSAALLPGINFAESRAKDAAKHLDKSVGVAHQHVEENLDKYKQSAAKEMKAQKGKNFETNEIESPGFEQPE